MIDLAGLEKARDQLWAETVHRFETGVPWWLETPELEALATAEQTARFVVDAWEERVRKWLGDRTTVSVWDVLEHALRLAASEQQTQSAQKRVVRILTRMGFAQHRPRTPGGREYRYERDSIPKKS
jgi:predicted P-loop ATPase